MQHSALLERLSALSPAARAALRTEVLRKLAEGSLADYRPYPKQRLFHDLGRTKRERLLRAGNQNGKSLAGGREAAYHLTGEYPDWWAGKRFKAPVLGWVSGETAESTRDNAQKQLLGEIGEWGTGAIPKRCLGEYGMATGTADLYDYVKVKHVSGQWSTLRMKYYAQGRRKWQGPRVDFVWFDEEPPEEIYDEGLARTIASAGCVYITATLLMGMSEVVRRFLMPESGADCRADVQMTIHEAEHISAEQKKKIIASFPAHEREARASGVPTLGSGRIYPVEESLITIPAFSIPAHWPRIVGMDFGWDHPTAAVWLAWDRDCDTVYVTDCYRRAEANPSQHAAVIRSKGAWIPVAWPHDGNNDTSAGPHLAKQYRDAGANMRSQNAKFPEITGDSSERARSRISVEAGISEILERMESGRFRVFSHLNDWFEEFRLYHRENGLIVKKMDDLLDATRIAIMDLRFAAVKPRDSAAVMPAFVPHDPGAGY